ncbi:UNVERIFIED_CONTAM: Sodium/calcium exchanger NCL1 [Sesamum calycinum]|uniref:Sodium/calcium exchanger NCL1 n=1 Tax=Sesamum calycinum TaxID=2727403 RepID=A0AAW2Q6K3_9LAMI
MLIQRLGSAVPHSGVRVLAFPRREVRCNRSNLFFQIIGPGIFGASLFQFLGTIPQIVLILVSTLSGSLEAAQQRASLGMGLVAGTTVMLLTLVWGTSVVLGSYDLSAAITIDKSGSSKSNLKGYGIVTDVETSYTARIMLITLAPFLILLLAKVFNSSSGRRVTILIALIVTFILLFAYIFYQIFQPWIQNRRFEYLMNKYAKDKLLRLLSTNGKPDTRKIQELFSKIDKDGSRSVSAAELRVLLLGVKMDDDDLSTDRDVENILGSFDTSGDGRISQDEFIKGMTTLISDISDQTPDRIKIGGGNNSQNNSQLQQGLLTNSTGTSTSKVQRFSNLVELLKGTFLCNSWDSYAMCARRTFDQECRRFLTSYKLAFLLCLVLSYTFALNYGAAIQSIASSRQKTQKSISLTLSALYGGVYMNNIIDGVDAVGIRPPLVNFDSSSPHLSSACVHTYGFFPCADNIGGYIFQIVVYQYLLIIGGKLITKGSKTIFNIIGTGVYGASVFRILTVFPKMVMVIVSGVLKSKRMLELKFHLDRKELFAKSATATGPSVSKCLVAREKLAIWKDTGATIDKKTCYTAGIMLVSLIPYIIVQLTDFVNSSFGMRIVILIALVVSAALLVSYFLYQIFDPWIQERSLEYSKYENLLAGFLQHVQRHAKEKLVDENGQPNIPVIKGLFHQTDKDEDKCITFLELENLIREIQSGKVQVEKDYAISEILKAFDLNNDGRIEEHEFVEGCKKWITEATQLAESGDSSARHFLREVVQPLSKKKRTKIAEIEHLMARILKHAQNQALEAEHLVTDDGRPNVERIKALFKQFDRDNSKSLSRPELEQLIHSTIMWGEVDDLVYEVGQNENKKLKLMTWEFNKSILEVILGIAILTFFCTSHDKSAILAIFPASQKSSRTSSLTFSEIYGGVVMNNMMGLSTLLAIVYIKELEWDYSAEVLTILVVCGIIGVLAYSQTTYPLWTCLLAFFLYPFSLAMYYVLQYILGWG